MIALHHRTGFARTLSSWVLLGAGFVALGYMATWGTASLMYRFGGVVTVAAVLILPATLAMLARALPQARRKIISLRSNWAWWHTLWFILVLSGCTFRARDIYAAHQEPVDSQAFVRICLVAIAALIVATFTALRGAGWLKSLFQGPLAPLTAYALVCAVSTVWSVFPSWTLYKSLEYLVDITCLAAIVTLIRSAHGYKAFLDWSWTLCGLLVCSIWLGVLLWPSQELLAEQGPCPGLFCARRNFEPGLYTQQSNGLVGGSLGKHSSTTGGLGWVLGPTTDSA
jgi:hypothetical protein